MRKTIEALITRVLAGLFLGLVLFLTVLAAVQGAEMNLSNNCVAYYSFDNANTSGQNFYNHPKCRGQTAGTALAEAGVIDTGIPGVRGESIRIITSESDRIKSTGVLSELQGAPIATVNMWLNISLNNSAGSGEFFQWGAAANAVNICDASTFSGHLTYWGAGAPQTSTIAFPVGGSFELWTFRINAVNGTWNILRNGTLVYTTTSGTYSCGNTVFRFGAGWTTGMSGGITGLADELSIFNRSLTADEIYHIYINGTESALGASETPPAPTVANLTIIANNTPVGYLLDIFNATVCGYYFSTTTGTIETNITQNSSSQLCNITVRADMHHALGLINHNASYDLTANLTQWVNVTVTDIVTSAYLTFNITATNGTHTDAANNTAQFRTQLVDIVNYSIRAGGYVALNQSSNASAQLRPTFQMYPIGLWAVTYGTWFPDLGLNLTRNLTYMVNLSCDPVTVTHLSRFINESRESQYIISCNGTKQTVTGNYTRASEGWFNISWYMNTSAGFTSTIGSAPFQADLNNPAIELSISVLHGFNAPNATTGVRCTDTAFPAGNLKYNVTFNGVAFIRANRTESTNATNNTLAIDGTNTLYAECKDLFGMANATLNKTVYYQVLALVDEETGGIFDLGEVTGAVAYFDDNSSNYDFKGGGTIYGNFTSVTTDKLRIVLTYGDGTVIVRYIDVSLISGDLRICAVENETTFYEQLLTSSHLSPVVLKNVYSNCVIAADYTRFAYQDSKVLKGYTIKSNYYLYTWPSDDIAGDQILLASIDGSIATYSNIDTLEFFLEGYDVSVVGDSISVKQRNGNETEIYYYNVQGDNLVLRIAIERRDTGEILLNTTDFTNPNSATIVFNHATLTGVNDTTLFKITVTRTTAAGDSENKQFFNLGGETGGISDGVIFIIGLLVIIFGLTFASTLHTFGWFGIFIILANIGIVSMATGSWYTTFLQGINVIILVFLVLVMSGKNSVSMV